MTKIVTPDGGARRNLKIVERIGAEIKGLRRTFISPKSSKYPLSKDPGFRARAYVEHLKRRCPYKISEEAALDLIETISFYSKLRDIVFEDGIVALRGIEGLFNKKSIQSRVKRKIKDIKGGSRFRTGSEIVATDKYVINKYLGLSD